MNLKSSPGTLTNLALASSAEPCLKTTTDGNLADSEQSKLSENLRQDEVENKDDSNYNKRSSNFDSPSMTPRKKQSKLSENLRQDEVENKDDSNFNKRSSNFDSPSMTPRKKPRSTNPREIPSLFRNIHPREIDARIRMLFPKDKVVSKPCMSARIFAYFTIYSEQKKSRSVDPNSTPLSTSTPKQKETPSRVTRRCNSLNIPILSLLQALVQVESSALGAIPVQRKIVQFSAFDGSSTRPPRDSIMGSHISRQLSINAMVDALQEIHGLLSLPHDDIERHNAVLSSLQALRQFLIMLETNTKTSESENESESERLRTECAKSMPFEWDPNRFKKAARLYRQEVDKICNCLEQQREVLDNATSARQMSLHEFNVMLYLETKLAESMGRAIRFHIRRIFNPIYGPVIIDETFEEEKEGSNYDDVFKRPSNMSQILQMRHPDWYSPGSNSAVADGSVSSVLNLAVETVVNYFGFDLFLTETEFVMPLIPEEFCNSAAALRGIPKKSNGKPFPREDLQAIVADTVEAQRFLAAAKACRFIRELLRWPGVDEEVSRLGGWDMIEQCAKQFHSLRLDRLSPNDAHLAVFKSVQTFSNRVDQCWSHVKKAAEQCTHALDDLWIRFQCDEKQSPKKSRKRRKQSQPLQEINIVKQVLTEGLQHHMFPSIAEPEESEEWIRVEKLDYMDDIEEEASDES